MDWLTFNVLLLATLLLAWFIWCIIPNFQESEIGALSETKQDEL